MVLFVLSVTLVACGGSSSGESRDTTAPVITLTGANPQVIEAGSAYVELGATASDNRDGDLSNSIAIDAGAVDTQVPGSYVVTYTVTDAAGNTGTATRTIVIEDTTPPVITLLGDDPQVIVAGNPYIELGATAIDTLDGDLSAQIVIDATAVDTMVAGDYTVTYDVTDAAGNAAVAVTRTVRVELPPPPAAPQVSVEGDIKRLIFSWDDVANADYYRLMETPDGHSGFTQVGDDIPIDTLAATRDIAVHLHDWVNALYVVQACNLGGCTRSAESSATDVMLDTIGYFKASNTELAASFGDQFGRALGLSADGSTLAIGARLEDSRATGINGDQADNTAESSGAVYLFRRDGSDWHQQAYFKASNTDASDGFGWAVSLSADGNTLVVGAPGEASSATGINGNEFDNSVPGAGAVYVFRFDGANWYQQAYVKASNTAGSFGQTVALSADGATLVVGSPGEDSSARGINGDQTDNLAAGAGAVYVFRFDGTDWYQQAYVKASNTDALDRFGSSVALSADGNALAVGATGEDSIATGINGDQGDNSSDGAGAAYLFRFDGVDWQQQAYVKASNTKTSMWCPARGPQPCQMTFGAAVGLSADGDTLVVGAPGEDSNSTGINGDENDESSEASGAVYLFRFNGATWDQQAYIKASNTGFNDNFGGVLALSADSRTLVVGAWLEDSSATGINGDQWDNSAGQSGAAYLFRFDGGDWHQISYIKSCNTDSGDHFGSYHLEGLGGTSVAVSADGSTIAVGAPYEASMATGVYGDRADNSAPFAGAVYVY